VEEIVCIIGEGRYAAVLEKQRIALAVESGAIDADRGIFSDGNESAAIS
jgi:hypothetical protein